MGRNKKYITPEDKKNAQNQWSKTYYIKNKDVINKKAMKKYYELRKNISSTNR